MSKQHHYLSSNNYPKRAGITVFPRNVDYDLIGSEYAHRAIWQQHHGVFLDPDSYIVHHKDHNKRNNKTCVDTSGHCRNWTCGNLGPMTRADHIREHKPGRMGGRRLPNKQPRQRYYCIKCGWEKSRSGSLCRKCYLNTTIRSGRGIR